MAFAQIQEQNTTLSDINITPLVDVMLVLLIIFMVAAPLASPKVKVILPEVNREEPFVNEPPMRAVTVAVTEDGRLFFNDEPVTQQMLESWLSVEAQKKPQPDVNIRGDKTTRYRHINEIINIVQAHGMRKVGFISTQQRN